MRVEAGALTLASRFVLGTEIQNPQRYTVRDTEALVEEFMLLANITVAKTIVRHFPMSSLLRRHPAPSKRQFDLLCSHAKAVGVELHVDTSKQLQDSLDAADALAQKGRNKGQRKHGNKTNPYVSFNRLLRNMMTHCMMAASFFSSGEVAPSEFHHFRLAAPIYPTYADVVVHRLLAAAIGVAPPPDCVENNSLLHGISSHLNRRYHADQRASRASETLCMILHFQQYPTRTDAAISNVLNNGVRVVLPDFDIQGMIFLCDKDGQDDEDVERYDGNHHTLTLVQKNNRKLQVFDRVRVKVYVAPTFGNRQELKMELLDEDEDDNQNHEAQKKAEDHLRAGYDAECFLAHVHRSTTTM